MQYNVSRYTSEGYETTEYVTKHSQLQSQL